MENRTEKFQGDRFWCDIRNNFLSIRTIQQCSRFPTWHEKNVLLQQLGRHNKGHTCLPKCGCKSVQEEAGHSCVKGVERVSSPG